jgi:predicted aspartyl protease
MPALIDTGAGRTVLTPEAVQKVGLSVIDYTMLARAGGSDRVPVHVASIQFPAMRMATIEIIQVLCCELPEQPIQCLIGRDLLSHWLFTYNGPSGDWSIEEEDLAAWVEPPEGMLT